MKKKFLCLLIAVLWCPLFMGAWDKDKPAATTSLRSSNPEMLENQSVLEDAIDNEHDFTTGSTQTGDHTQGSARCFSQAGAPATRIDGAGFLSTDLGSIWVDTDDNAVYVLTATSPTWTPVSTEIIATLLGVPRTFLDTLDVTGTFAAIGAATVAGTLDVTGATELIGIATIADASLTKTSAAPSTDAMIANKKYVDDTAMTAYVNFSTRTSNGACTVNSSRGVTGVARIGTGEYTITWSTAFADANYIVTGMFEDVGASENLTVKGSDTNPATTTYTLQLYAAAGQEEADANQRIHVMAIGTQ